MASPLYRSDDPQAPLRLVVLGDSTAFAGPQGPLLPDEPALYPNVAASMLAERLGRPVTVSVLAHPGAGVRDSHYAVTKDRHVMFEVLMKADALVIGIGSFDHAPVGVLPVIEGLVKHVPVPVIRRRIRATLRVIHPWGVRLTFGRITRVGAAEFERLYDRIMHEARSLSWGVPAVALGPTSHRSPYYGHTHPQHAARTALQARVAASHGIAFLESWPHVEPFAEKLNPDGIHWPFEAHERVGRAVAEALLPQLTGDLPRPGIPGFPDFAG